MTNAAPAAGQVTPERIAQMAWGYAPPLLIEAAIRHRIFDVLDAGPKTADEVAAATGASVRGLKGLMNALVGLEFLAKEGDRYRLTPESAAFLVQGKPGFQGGIFKHISRQLIPKWLQLCEVVQTGKPATAVNQEGEGQAFFEQLVEDIFPMSYPGALALGDALGLPAATQPVSVLDLGAGSGVWGIALSQKSPQVRVTAVDWPNVLPVTRRVAERFGLGDRFHYVAGDLAEVDFGTGYDVATLGHILHGEGAARSRALLKKVSAALKPGGTVAIGEMIPNEERTGPAFPLIFAVNMLVNTEDGDTFPFGEISAWLREAGFAEPRTLDAPGPSPLVLATKPAA